LARDIVRQVQEARKAAGLDVSDHIRLVLYFPPHEPELRHAAEEHRELIAGETLADEIVFADSPIADSFRATVADGRAFHIGIVKLPNGR
jgi:isoleucyl-tRNA synthetase